MLLMIFIKSERKNRKYRKDYCDTSCFCEIFLAFLQQICYNVTERNKKGENKL